ncbi:MAG: hypothetical protein D6785_07795 [Planctomycetota bacterium]|nr:MAG: hypothetical protein D6785_07795 [Planctomycetota bacterium]
MDWQTIIFIVVAMLALLKLTSWGRKREKILDKLIEALLRSGIKPSSFLRDPLIEKKEKQKEQKK